MAMKKCKECGTEISSSAKVCPNCGKKQKVSGCLVAFIVVIVLIILGSLAGKNSDTNNNNVNNDVVKTSAIAEDTVLDGEGTIGNYDVKIGNYSIQKNSSGESILLVGITYTNNSEMPQAFYTGIDAKAYQNGVEITTPISTYGISNYNWEDKTKEIQPGVAYEFNLAYTLSDNTSDVTIELLPIFSTKYSTKVTKTFVIK